MPEALTAPPLLEKVPRPIAFVAEQSDPAAMERHRAILRAMKAWAWRVGQDHPAYAERVSLSDALADEVIEVVIQNDLLRQFDPPDDPEALKRRALERAAKAWVRRSDRTNHGPPMSPTE